MVDHPDNLARQKMRDSLIEDFRSRRLLGGMASNDDLAGDGVAGHGGAEPVIFVIDDYRDTDVAFEVVDDSTPATENGDPLSDWHVPLHSDLADHWCRGPAGAASTGLPATVHLFRPE